MLLRTDTSLREEVSCENGAALSSVGSVRYLRIFLSSEGSSINMLLVGVFLGIGDIPDALYTDTDCCSHLHG